MKNSLVGLVLVMLLGSFCMRGQQSTQYTQYMYNTMSINPAYAGSLGTLDIVGIYRNQWTGISGSPETQNLGVHSPLRNQRLGLGLNVSNENLGPSNNVLLDGNISYSVPLSPTIKMAFGIKAGMNILSLDYSKGDYQNSQDPIFQENVTNSTSFTMGAGTYVYSDKWYVGLSIPNFFTENYYDDIASSISEGELQYFLMGGYVFDIGPSFKLKPAFLVKYATNIPTVVDISANALFLEKFTLGVSYRYDDSVSALAGFQILPSVFVGYAYDHTNSGLGSYASGTHELMLRFTLPSKFKIINSQRFF